MPLTPPTGADERETLLNWLAHGRYLLVTTAYGLSDEQAHMSPTVSALSIAGLIAHSGAVERSWLNLYLSREADRSGRDDPDEAFRIAARQSLAEVLADYAAAAANTESVVSAVDDLGHLFPAKPGLRFGDVESWSMRWLLQHLIVQTARHTGHADLIRETVDGGTWIPLVAAAEAWPPDGEITPWTGVEPIPD